MMTCLSSEKDPCVWDSGVKDSQIPMGRCFDKKNEKCKGGIQDIIKQGKSMFDYQFFEFQMVFDIEKRTVYAMVQGTEHEPVFN